MKYDPPNANTARTHISNKNNIIPAFISITYTSINKQVNIQNYLMSPVTAFRAIAAAGEIFFTAFLALNKLDLLMGTL